MVARCAPVVTQYRLGSLGKLRVTYVTFSAHQDHAIATETAEEDLKFLSRIRHPNVATIAGITRGYDGLNGFVVAMAGIPIKKMFETPVASGVLARCIIGLEQAIDFLGKRQDRCGVHWRSTLRQTDMSPCCRQAVRPREAFIYPDGPQIL